MYVHFSPHPVQFMKIIMGSFDISAIRQAFLLPFFGGCPLKYVLKPTDDRNLAVLNCCAGELYKMWLFCCISFACDFLVCFCVSKV